jgi:hypothetical protein
MRAPGTVERTVVSQAVELYESGFPSSRVRIPRAARRAKAREVRFVLVQEEFGHAGVMQPACRRCKGQPVIAPAAVRKPFAPRLARSHVVVPRMKQTRDRYGRHMTNAAPKIQAQQQGEARTLTNATMRSADRRATSGPPAAGACRQSLRSTRLGPAREPVIGAFCRDVTPAVDELAPREAEPRIVAPSPEGRRADAAGFLASPFRGRHVALSFRGLGGALRLSRFSHRDRSRTDSSADEKSIPGGQSINGQGKLFVCRNLPI